MQLFQTGHTLSAARRPLLSVRRLLRPTRTQLHLFHLMLQLLHLRLQQLHRFSQPAHRAHSSVRSLLRDVLVQKTTLFTKTVYNHFTGTNNPDLPSYPWIFCWAVLLSRTSLRLLCSSSRADTSSCSYTLACWSLTCLRRSTCFVRYWRRDGGSVQFRERERGGCCCMMNCDLKEV